MNVNRNSLIQNDQTVENKQPVEGKLKHSKLTLGEPKPKTTESTKNYFSSLKKSITKRFAKIVKFIKSLGGNKSPASLKKGNFKSASNQLQSSEKIDHKKELTTLQKVIVKATPDQLRTGEIPGLEQALNSDNGNPLAKQYNEREQNPKEFLKKLASEFVNAMIKEDGKLDMNLIPNPIPHLRALLEPTINVKEPGAILRGNTVDSKFLSAFFKSVGGGYVESVLKPTIEELKLAGNLEVDPRLIDVKPEDLKDGKSIDEKKKEMAATNIRKLGEIYQNLMNNLAKSVDKMPQEMRDVAALLYAAIKNKGGDDQTARNGASASIILRLLNPALLQPDVNAPNKDSLPLLENNEQRRAALLLSKLFQNQANTVLSYEKGKDHNPMTALEGKLQENDPMMQQFLKAVISKGVVPDDLDKYVPRNVGDVENQVQVNQTKPTNDTEANEIEEFKNEVKRNFEDINNEAFIEVSGENVDDLVGEEIFDVINRDGGGFREEDSEVKVTTPETVQHNQEENTVLNDIKEEFVQRNKEEDELMNELLNLKKN